jgi:hypothetical protein
VDIVNFGEESHNTEKLEVFIKEVNNGNNRFALLLTASHIFPFLSFFFFLLI